MSGVLFVITAPSGAGKTTLVRLLLEHETSIRLSISTTTREPRTGEVNGREYHFVSKEEFQSMIACNEFIEWAEVHGNFYGTSKAWIQDQLANGQDVLLEIDWQGAQQVRQHFPNLVGIFIVPPSLKALDERLHARGTDAQEVIARRIGAARQEMRHMNEFDYVIINDSLEIALLQLRSIACSSRLTYSVQSKCNQALFQELV